MSLSACCPVGAGARYMEMKDDDDSRAFVRALASDGVIEAGLEHDPILDEALHGVERALAEWMQAQVLKERDRHDSRPSDCWDQPYGHE
jgi:hypothetical protein